jgi:predicted Zn-dependent protease with MMP-like domain
VCGNAAEAMDADLRHADSAWPPDLQAEAALRSMRDSRRLQLLPQRARGRCASTQGCRRQASSAPEAWSPKPEAKESPVTREAFTELVEQALREIPRRFRKAMRNVAVVVEEEPSPDILEEMEIDEGDTLFGLYHGTPLTQRGWGYGNSLPDRISIYQGPIEEACGDEQEIRDCITETVIHEFGHYFGMSEEEIEEIEEKFWRGESIEQA